jgi:hypothetical protein
MNTRESFGSFASKVSKTDESKVELQQLFFLWSVWMQSASNKVINIQIERKYAMVVSKKTYKGCTKCKGRVYRGENCVKHGLVPHRYSVLQECSYQPKSSHGEIDIDQGNDCHEADSHRASHKVMSCWFKWMHCMPALQAIPLHRDEDISHRTCR